MRIASVVSLVGCIAFVEGLVLWQGVLLNARLLGLLSLSELGKVIIAASLFLFNFGLGALAVYLWPRRDVSAAPFRITAVELFSLGALAFIAFCAGARMTQDLFIYGVGVAALLSVGAAGTAWATAAPSSEAKSD